MKTSVRQTLWRACFLFFSTFTWAKPQVYLYSFDLVVPTATDHRQVVQRLIELLQFPSQGDFLVMNVKCAPYSPPLVSNAYDVPMVDYDGGTGYRKFANAKLKSCRGHLLSHTAVAVHNDAMLSLAVTDRVTIEEVRSPQDHSPPQGVTLYPGELLNPEGVAWPGDLKSDRVRLGFYAGSYPVSRPIELDSSSPIFWGATSCEDNLQSRQ